MKDFFKNKINIFLLLVLTTLLVVGGFLAFKFFQKPSVVAIDFTKMSESEIIDWAKENGVEDKLEITHQFDENVKEGEVVYFSVKEGEAIDDKLLIIISNGKDTSDEIVITYDANTTIDELKEFFRNNNFISVSFIYDENSNLEDGQIISISPSSAAPDDNVIVTVAGKEEQEGNIEVPDLAYYSDQEAANWAKTNSVNIKYVYQDDAKTKGTILSQSPSAGKKINKDDTITLTLSSGTTGSSKAYIDPYEYMGESSSGFINALNGLGFTNLKKLDSIYSDKYQKDTICYYLPDGKQSTSEEISYKISLGKYEFDKTAFQGLTKDEGDKLVKTLAAKKAPVESLKTTETETSSYNNGTLYDCSLDSKTVTCKLAKNSNTSTDTNEKTVYIDPYDYLDYTDTEFIKALKELGFTNLKKETAIYSNYHQKDTVCYYLPDGNQKTNTEIVYKLSLGKFSFDASLFKGKTKAEGESIVADLKSKGAPVESLTVTEQETTAYDNGTLYDCSLSNSKVACKLAKSSSSSSSKSDSKSNDSAYIDPNAYFGKTDAEFVKALNNLGFTNLKRVFIYSPHTKDTVRAYLPDGTQNKSTQITYSVSAGSFNANDFKGLTIDSAANKINSLNNDGYNLTLKTTETSTSSYENGTLYDCSYTMNANTYSAQTVTCKLAKAESSKPKEEVKKQTIIEFDTLTSFYSKNTYDDSKKAITNYFTNLGFTNVTCEGTSSSKSVGTILSISVDGNSDYKAGAYPLSSKIVVTISNKFN